MNDLLAHLSEFAYEPVLIRELYIRSPVDKSHLIIRSVALAMDDQVAFKTFLESPSVVALGSKHDALEFFLLV